MSFTKPFFCFLQCLVLWVTGPSVHRLPHGEMPASLHQLKDHFEAPTLNNVKPAEIATHLKKATTPPGYVTSSSDALLQISHAILYGMKRHTRAVLAVDLTKAFDRHSAILQGIQQLHLGPRTYIRAFLNGRTASLPIDDVRTPPFPLVLSRIPHLGHTLYADDITVWTTYGSDDDIESTLQEAATAIATQEASIGLECSPTKSALLILRQRRDAQSIHPSRIRWAVLREYGTASGLMRIVFFRERARNVCFSGNVAKMAGGTARRAMSDKAAVTAPTDLTTLREIIAG
ncbi:hypothetical protein HPB50_006294 [Hyalomma asiaticum]|uniref:Uncharacterized protein n=1 Tax=Hyalomma asiaticum TaxID=266040 RepID=A0ACB7SD29_HYAAI|nr:hypothetical protein HPB50_006294 [Hyalomma asiaticum]